MIMPGTSTLQIAIALPIRAVPINSSITFVRERIIMPIVSTIIQVKRVCSIPNRVDNFGAASANIAKAMSGKVVNIPARV
ncbi:hypothetical protein D3C76_1560340 [compost metagenome]